jgi:hypothetical protein
MGTFFQEETGLPEGSGRLTVAVDARTGVKVIETSGERRGVFEGIFAAVFVFG